MNNHSTIGYVAGKSAGHLLPCITHAQNYVNQNPESTIVFFTTTTSLEKSILDCYSFIDHRISLHLDSVYPKKVWRYPWYIWQFIHSFIKAFITIKKTKPEKLVSMGGYSSIPVCLAAFLQAIPIELFELNAVPGRAIKFLAPFATAIYTCFTTAQNSLPSEKCKYSPYPIRFTNQATVSSRHILESLNFCFEKKTILVLGGSQGSLFINTIMKQWISDHPNAHTQIQIIHQTGTNNHAPIAEFYKNLGISAYIFEYDNAMERYYSAADSIICRSGAGTLFEILYFNKPCITIPLQTTTTSHQRNNAHALAIEFPDKITVLEQEEVRSNPTLFAQALNTHLMKANPPVYHQDRIHNN